MEAQHRQAVVPGSIRLASYSYGYNSKETELLEFLLCNIWAIELMYGACIGF